MKDCSECPSYRLQLPTRYSDYQTYHYCFELGRKSKVPEHGCRPDCPLNDGLAEYLRKKKKGG